MEDLKEIYGNAVIDLPHNELIILALAQSEGEVSNSSLQNMVELHPSDLTKILRKMCKDGFLISYGFGRGTSYKLNRDYVASSEAPARNDSFISEAVNQTNKGLENNRSNELTSSASSDVASSDVASSDVASSTEENVISMIKACCAYKWFSAKEISEKIGRHPTHTRRIIKRMLAEGVLKAEFPDQPTHPAQRYRVK